MSTETKFTKGEWRINDDIDGLSVAFNDDGELITDYVYELADAHLIVAAPNMYEEIEQDIRDLKDFLVTLKENSHDYIYYTSKLTRKEQLLAQARGE